MKKIQELAQLASEGNYEALLELYDFYLPQLSQLVRGFSGLNAQDAEDTLEGIFIHICFIRKRLPQIENLHAYILTIAKNRILDLYDSQKARLIRNHHYFYLLGEEPAASDRPLLDKEEQALLDQAIDRLPPKQRETLRLSVHEGLSNAEIAARLGLHPDTVEKRLYHARKKVREWLKKQAWNVR
jgi:RNA polymerase sigma-70 factor (ECF subfamily)